MVPVARGERRRTDASNRHRMSCEDNRRTAPIHAESDSGSCGNTLVEPYVGNSILTVLPTPG
jgi:hypothetical protein